MMKVRAPVATVDSTVRFRAYEWNSGRGESTRSLADSPQIGAQHAAVTHSIPRTFNSTPLARPVVPEV